MNSHHRIARRVSLISLAATSLVLTQACGNDNPPVSQDVSASIRTVSINELQTRNSVILSDTGKKSDWVEFYNDGEAAVSLDGYFISDDKDALLKAMLPEEAIVPANGFLLLWLDDTASLDTPLHFPFKLSGDGENFYFSSPMGKLVKKLAIPADPTGTDTTAPDVSYGAYPDGSSDMVWCRTPTPGKPNADDCGSSLDAGI